MKNDELFEALSYIDPKLIEEAKPQVMRRKSSRLLAPIAAVLVIAIVLGLFFGRWNPFKSELPSASEASSGASSSLPSGRPVQTLALCAYPTSETSAPNTADASLDPFLKKTVTQFLANAENENRAYSPLSLYFALAAAASSSGGETQKQILDLLGEDDADSLLATAKSVWNRDYFRKDQRKTLFASSLWFADDLSPDKALLSALSENLYLSAYACEMGTQEASEAFRQWLNEQTSGLLSDSVSNLELSESTRFAIASTVDFFAKWYCAADNFTLGKAAFHGTQSDVCTEFLNSFWSSGATYFYGEKFTALSLELRDQGQMLFILPDVGYTTADLLSDDAAIELIVSGERARREQESREAVPGSFGYNSVIAYLSIPKFDISSNLDLKGGLKELGVTDCFNENADFSPLLGEEKAGLAAVDHGVRVAIDEEGVTAAAYTVMIAETGLPQRPPQVVNFIADRPFLFVITGRSGLPLFVGEINQLTGEPTSELPFNAADALGLDEIEAVHMNFPKSSFSLREIDLTETEIEAFRHILSCIALEDAQELPGKKVQERNQSTITVTGKNGEVKTLCWGALYPEEYVGHATALLYIDDRCYCAAETQEKAFRLISAASTQFLSDHWFQQKNASQTPQ